jgi:arabinofuranan 3-O-arabinosyltransferase
MPFLPARLTDRLLDWFDPVRIFRFLVRARSRWVLAWLVTLVSVVIALAVAWRWGNDPHRRDGNGGHASIDFAGQWLMARMLVEGRGRHLYHRNHLRAVLTANFPRSHEAPDQESSDAENLAGWLMGRDHKKAPDTIASLVAPLGCGDLLGLLVQFEVGTDPEQGLWREERLEPVLVPQIGGSLYPPVQALLWSPLALLAPPLAYRCMQVFTVALLFLGGWLIVQITEKRIWWPVAVFYLLIYPGYGPALNLGQNPMVSLVLLLLGWWLLTRQRPVLAGVAWGFLAFKPVWAVSFLLVPLLTRRWRMLFAMGTTGLALILVTLPLVGWQSWLDWLAVGQMGSRGYLLYENWVFLGRDLLSLSRRWLHQFDDGWNQNAEWRLPTYLGWSAWLVVLAITLVVAWWNRTRPVQLTGLGPCFVLLGAWFACLHFMYYDVLLTALPVILLFAQPGQYLELRFWRKQDQTWLEHHPECLPYYRPTLDDPIPPVPPGPEESKRRWVRNSFLLTFLTLFLTVPYVTTTWIDRSHHAPPFDTLGVVILWGWCGWQWTAYGPG